MLAPLLVAATALNVAPLVDTRATTAFSRVNQPIMAERKGAFWQRADWIEKSEAAGAASAVTAAAPAPAASSASLTVAQACTFLADPSVASVSFADKKAFLASKGISEFVIAEAACTAPDLTLVL